MTETPAMRHIDHIVVAVRYLDQAADVYRKLGFHVGPRNQHPWGTENRIIQFRSSFMELITTGDAAHRILPHESRRFSFGAFVRDYLEKREGIAMLVLSSVDAAADTVQFAERGIGDFEPFYFERKGRKPDGSETRVAFTLAFARDAAAPDAGFFVCQQHFPQNFWNRSFQQHANSAMDLTAVTLTAADPNLHAEFLAAFSGVEGHRQSDGGLRFVLDRGRVDVVSTSEAQTHTLPSPLLTSASVKVGDLDHVVRILTTEKIPYSTADGRIVIAQVSLFGTELRFEA